MTNTKNLADTFQQATNMLIQHGAQKGGDIVDGIVMAAGFDTFVAMCEAESKRNGLHYGIVVAMAIYYGPDEFGMCEKEQIISALTKKEVA